LRHAAGPVPRSASTCLLIVRALLWYISDGTKLQFGREGWMSSESSMLYERSRSSKANREDVDPAPRSARDEVPGEALEIRS
jgi:hypothetical protein